MASCKVIARHGVWKQVLTGLLVAFLCACGGVSEPGADSEATDTKAAALSATTTAVDPTTAAVDPTTAAVDAATAALRLPRVKHINLLNGVTLEYLEQGVPLGTPIIFIHGYTNSYHAFDLDLPLFPVRYHLYAIDLRGHGNSSKPACCYTQNDFARDVVRFMDLLGIPRATLVGHSMGSFIAQSVALKNPARVDKLVLIASAPTVAGNPVALGLQSAVNSLVDPISPDFVRGFLASTFFQPPSTSFLDTAVTETLKVPASIWQQALDGLIAEDHSARLSDIHAPTLILHGDQDVFFSATDQATLDAVIPNSTLIVYPQIGHETQEEAPSAVARDIQAFVH